MSNNKKPDTLLNEMVDQLTRFVDHGVSAQSAGLGYREALKQYNAPCVRK
jgi:hypothetical protein